MSRQDDQKEKPGQPLRLPSLHSAQGHRSATPKRSSSRQTPPPDRSPQRNTPGKAQFRSPQQPGASQSGGRGGGISDRERLAPRHAPPEVWRDSRPRGNPMPQSSQRPEEEWADPEPPPAKSDPWDRDWAGWSSSHGFDSYDEGDEEDWSSLKRDAWGAWPEEYTAASVAITVSPHLGGRAGTTGKDTKALRQLGRWVRSGLARRAKPSKRVMNLVLLTTILGTIVLSILGIGGAAYLDYKSLKDLADSGLSALEHVTEDLGLGSHSTGGQKVDPAHITMAGGDINLALSDFQQIHDRLANPDLLLSLASHVSSLKDKLQSALLLSQVAIDAANVMYIFLPALIDAANVINTSPFSTGTSAANTPLLDTSDLATIDQALQSASQSSALNDLLALLQNTPSGVLFSALSSSQQQKVGKYLKYIPQVRPVLNFLLTFLPNYAAQVLDINAPGVSKPVAYLLMTLDNSEIRPIGGFQGQYAVFSVNGGRIGHISLEDVYKYLEPKITTGPYAGDYTGTAAPTPPADGWIDATHLAFAFRNSGVSPDFPQSARDALVALQGDSFTYNNRPYTGGDRVPILNSSGNISTFSPEANMAGVIMIQPKVIEQLIAFTGPLKVGCPYNKTVTPQNLEQYIHESQETTTGRQAVNDPSCPNTTGSTKRFTALLSQALQQQVKNMPKDKLLQFVTMALGDLRTKDLQMYFADTANPQANLIGSNVPEYDRFQPNVQMEAFLAKYQSTGALYNGPQDSLTVSQANIIGDKMDQFLSMQWVDNITIGNFGTAIHMLTLNYNWNIPQITVPFPYDTPVNQLADNQAIYNVIFNAGYLQTYKEFQRIYVHANANLRSYTGVSESQYLPAVPVSSGQQPGLYNSDVPGLSAISGYYQYQWSVTPAQMVSWLAPYGGNPAISWSVPNVATGDTYVLHLEPQSGMPTSVDITITPPSCATNQTPYVYNKPLTSDTTITLTFKGCKF